MYKYEYEYECECEFEYLLSTRTLLLFFCSVHIVGIFNNGNNNIIYIIFAFLLCCFLCLTFALLRWHF